MTIIQLEYLLAVANYGSFSLASEHCFVTQPSLSIQIKNLEDELGVILLKRNEKPISLTEAGKVVVHQAKKAIANFYAITESISQSRNEVKGLLRLGVIPTIAPYLLHRFLPIFINTNPNVEIEVREIYTQDIEAELKSDNIDIGILAAGFIDSNEIVEEILFKDTFYVYHSAQSPLKDMQEVHIADIDVKSLILLPNGNCLRTQIIDLCSTKNLKKEKILFESGSLMTISQMVDGMNGVTIFPEMAIFSLSEAQKQRIKPFSPIINAYRDIALATSKNFYKKSIYNALKEQIINNK